MQLWLNPLTLLLLQQHRLTKIYSPILFEDNYSNSQRQIISKIVKFYFPYIINDSFLKKLLKFIVCDNSVDTVFIATLLYGTNKNQSDFMHELKTDV